MGVGLHGNLRDFGIAEVFQLIGQQRKTGSLEIGHGQGTYSLSFDSGSVASAAWVGENEFDALADMLVRCGCFTRERAAEIGRESLASARAYHVVAVESGAVPADEMERIVDLLTKDIVFQVLRLDSGSFHFSTGAVSHDRPTEKLLAAEQILMEGLRMMDEWATFAVHVPREDAVFRRSDSFGVYRQRSRDSEEGLRRAERFFELVDGRLSVRRIIDLSRLGTFDGTRILAGLKQAGAIEGVESAKPAVEASEGSVLRSVFGGLKAGVLSAFPLLLLAAVLASIGTSWLEAPQTPGVEIAAHTFERSTADFERLRVRHALEAHRFLWANWPETVKGTSRTGWAPGEGSAMAVPDADSYYYAARGEEVVLLSPAQGSGR